MRRRAWLHALAATTALALVPAWGWAQITITPDVGGLRGLGTNVTQSGQVFTVDGGTLAGANLFHSFSQFSLGQGATAQWTRAGDAAAVRNVINRVTGGQASTIAGTIDSTALPNASFFFINPAGIVFTAGAVVNVPGAAYFSTAGELRLADGARFAVAAPDGSTLSMAAPESFGFVGGQGAISLEGVRDTFTPGAVAALSLTASDVRVDGSQFFVSGLDLIAVGGGAATVGLADPLAGAGGAGAVEIQDSLIATTPGAGVSRPLRVGGGTVSLNGATLASDTGGPTRGGDVLVQAGVVRLSNSGTIGAATRGVARGGDVSILAGDIQATGGILYTLADQGDGGRLSLDADTITLTDVTLSSNAAGAGVGGDIEVVAGTLLGTNVIAISQGFGAGAGGDVILAAEDLELVEAVGITGALGAGSPGDVAILGDRISISGGSYGSSPGGATASGNLTIAGDTSLEIFGSILTASTFSDEAAGVITLRAPDLYLGGVFIDSNSFAGGAAGQVTVDGGDIVFDEVRLEAESQGAITGDQGRVRISASGDILFRLSDITSASRGQAQGGVVEVSGGNVTLDDTRINSDTFGDGDGGAVSIKATGDFRMSNGAISSDAVVFTGDAGDVTVEAGSIHLDFSAAITSDTFDQGAAGNVTIRAGEILLEDGATIRSTAQEGTGGSGTVSVDATSLTLTDATITSDTRTPGDAGNVVIRTGDLLVAGQGRMFTFISSDTLGAGDAGGVTIEARSIVLRDQGYVSSNAFSDGAGGPVTIRTGSLLVQDGSYVAADTMGIGRAGDVSVTAEDLQVVGNGGSDLTYISSDGLGGGDAGTVTIDAKSLKVDMRGFISSDTYDFGKGGDVTVRADSVVFANEGFIRSGTFSNGDAGNILVEARALTLVDGGTISSEALVGSVGNAGTVAIFADTLSVGDLSRVSTSTAGDGNAGSVAIAAQTLIVEGGLISSASDEGATGASNALFIEADAISLTNAGGISTVSTNANMAGQIDITVGSLTIEGAGSGISSSNEAEGAGDAGSIFVDAAGIRIANGGAILTNSQAGAAGEIDLRLPSGSILTLEGADLPGSIETSSGPGTGGRITIASPLAIVSNGGSILALGQQAGANVVIQSRYFINSTDRSNVVAVDGEIRLETGLYDVSSGVVSRDLSVLDASKVLRGQCPAARSAGAVSQLISRPVGPYVRETEGAGPTPAPPASPGACP
ncbi:filamentous hemagglutinin N-terminal domain-containing protein [uncultured Phenylobacterium sp.]|uniref:beta strand repeat-containing protein n=1 Tax=uncultured Phenylobacterium sp. TaxID=349273 RepID=UPI0025D5355E|nr:filamentous hemagglutinin N-terminal domain-containing protein [uncultured Phenylobacterium sp.]